eukprot:282429-Rhodomonas_salina.2
MLVPDSTRVVVEFCGAACAWCRGRRSLTALVGRCRRGGPCGMGSACRCHRPARVGLQRPCSPALWTRLQVRASPWRADLACPVPVCLALPCGAPNPRVPERGALIPRFSERESEQRCVDQDVCELWPRIELSLIHI